MNIFIAAYFVAIFIEMAIRAPIRKAQRGDAKSENYIQKTGGVIPKF